MNPVDDDAEPLTTALTALHAWQRRAQVPGLAAVVTDRERTRLVDLSGLACRSPQRPLAPDQRWQIGSVSKAFAAIAVLQLQQGGRLELGDPVRRHLPWADVDPAVTLHHLLTHSSGLVSGPLGLPDTRLRPASMGRLGRRRPAGSPFHYSNVGYETVGDVLEAVCGARVEEVLESRVLQPLGMAGATAAIRAPDRERDVRGHRPPHDDRVWDWDGDQVPDTWFPTCTADGSIVTSAAELACYLRLLLNGGAPGVLDRAGFELLTARHVPLPTDADDDRTGHYGYGVDVVEDALGVTLGHSGGMVGQYCDVRVDPQRGIGTAVLVNGWARPTLANRALLDHLRVSHDAGQGPAASADLASPLVSLAQDRPREAVVDDGSGPSSWACLVAQYRSFNPWQPVLEVVRREGRLELVDPAVALPEPLVPVDPAEELPERSDRPAGPTFTVGRADSPELVVFGAPVLGDPQLLDVSGERYVRVRRRAVP
jgi:D-alanyl-D-alanine carboxypeptidase